MKQFLFFGFLFMTYIAVGQTDTTTYCMIVGETKFMSNNINVSIDDGSDNGSWTNPKFNYLKDKNGKKISFETMVSALNFMSEKGWKFVDAYAIHNDNRTVYHWLLSKGN